MSENRMPKCRKCGAETSDGSNYCSSCGARIYDIEKLMAPGKFSVKLAAWSAILTIISIMFFSFFTAYFYTLYDQDIMSSPEKLVTISMIGPAIGIFISSLFTSYIFTEIRIKETFTGASLTILLFKISDFILASAFTIEGIGVALLSCFISFAGAYLGFFAKKKIKFKN